MGDDGAPWPRGREGNEQWGRRRPPPGAGGRAHRCRGRRVRGGKSGTGRRGDRAWFLLGFPAVCLGGERYGRNSSGVGTRQGTHVLSVLWRPGEPLVPGDGRGQRPSQSGPTTRRRPCRRSRSPPPSARTPHGRRARSASRGRSCQRQKLRVSREWESHERAVSCITQDTLTVCRGPRRVEAGHGRPADGRNPCQEQAPVSTRSSRRSSGRRSCPW